MDSIEPVAIGLGQQGEEWVWEWGYGLGCLAMMMIAGLSSLAGLGGGGPNVVVLILCFDILPKEATIVVFACIFGASFGNIVNQSQRALDGDPVICYQHAFVTIPIMLIGTIFGVISNKVLPSIVIASIIIGVATYSLPKIYERFREGHRRQTQELLLREQEERRSQAIKETSINPFAGDINRKIFKQITILVLCFFGLSLLRGTDNFPSFLGIQNCSLLYWLFQIGMLLLGWAFYRSHRRLLELWTAPTVTLGEELFEREDVVALNEYRIIRDSLCAGVFSGLGLGGGVFLVPLYRQLKLNPIQASSTCIFTVFVTAGINVIQALLLGVLGIGQFLFFFGLTASSSLVLSMAISKWLRKANRNSYVELLLLILLSAANLVLPYSLWRKYQDAGGDLSVIFGFGTLC